MIATLNKEYLQLTFILLISLIVLSDCNQNSDQDDFMRQAFSEPTGITETNQQGQVGSADPDDWRIAPFFQGEIEIAPPSPNPVQSNERLRIELQVYFPDRINGIYIRVFHHIDNFPVIDDRQQVTTGFTTFNIDPRNIAGRDTNLQGSYRIIIQNENEHVITYGDVKIE